MIDGSVLAVVLVVLVVVLLVVLVVHQERKELEAPDLDEELLDLQDDENYQKIDVQEEIEEESQE